MSERKIENNDSCRGKCDIKVHQDLGNEEEEFNLRKILIILGIGVVLYVLALVSKSPQYFKLGLFLISYIVIGGDILLKAIKNIFRLQFFDENFLLSIATIGAFAIGEYPEAVAVMLFFKVGELFQDLALDKSRDSIKSLLEIKPDYANIEREGHIEKVNPEDVEIGDIIVVKPGERVPLDGVIIDGNAVVDTSALTGESLPRELNKGDEILSGMVNQTGLIKIKVTKKFYDSTISKILDLVQNAETKKAPTEKFITKFARYYTPLVVAAAVLMAVIPVILYKINLYQIHTGHKETFSEWIYKALIFLVISCPCALVISIPLGFFGGIGSASKSGILVKGANHLEALNNLTTVVWDKTGTLTKGVFKVVDVITTNNYSKEEILKFSAIAESRSNHPIALSILDAYNKKVNIYEISEYQELAGLGIKAKIEEHIVMVGNDKLLHKENVKHNTCNVNGTVVHVVIDKKYAGYILIADEIKEDAKLAIENLKKLKIKKQIMLTGDSKEVAEKVAKELNIDEFYAELLPYEKVEIVENLIKKKETPKEILCFVGDGINDAPVLKRADLGIAMGGLGSDMAIESADIVIMNDEPSKLPIAIKIAKRTKTIVWENIIFALGVKGFFLISSSLGFATMWEAVFADVGVALLAILNATRILRWKK